MNRWQVRYPQGVLGADAQLAVTVVDQAAPQQVGIDMEVWPLQGVLDLHLSEAGSAEIEPVIVIGDQRHRFGRELLGLSGRP